MQRWFASLSCLLMLSATVYGAEPQPKVLFIGIDGCRWDAVEAAQTPNINALTEQGWLAVGTSILAPHETKGDTVSGPGWSNLLCGVWPDKHGVLDNSFRGANYTDYPHYFARIKAARPELLTASFTDWDPLKDKILSAADYAVDLPAHGAADYAKKDAELATECADYIRTKPVDAVMLYFGQVDETGHAKGFHPKVPEYVAAIERVDGLIGQVREAIAARPNIQNENWLILIGTDHGGVGTNHGGGRQIPEIHRTFMIVSGPAAIKSRTEEDSYQVDIIATALAHLGITPDPSWKLDGQPRGLKPKPAAQ
ncbi:sulfatase-like hydrolase/transferase [bacterium]|nr:sulfatase-like hydrolase/transferase [bacterium]